jgi:hypothetical protein
LPLTPLRDQLLPSDWTADLSDDSDLPSLTELLRHSEQVIDLIGDDDNDDDDEEGGDDSNDIPQVSCPRITSSGRDYMILTPALLVDPFHTINPLLLLSTVLAAAVSRAHRRRPRSIYSSHTSWRETPLDECPLVVPVAPQPSTTPHYASSRTDH